MLSLVLVILFFVACILVASLAVARMLYYFIVLMNVYFLFIVSLNQISVDITDSLNIIAHTLGKNTSIREM